jgi:HIV Tat-specific factor 1
MWHFSLHVLEVTGANAFLQLMDGRLFSGTRVEAYIADGSEKFKKTSEKKISVNDDDEEEDARLDKFGNWLEEGEEAREA